MPSGVVTFLFTDIEGSTRLWEEHPSEMRAALALHDAVLRAAVEGAGGRVFKVVGDSVCAVFERATQAVAGAIAGQRAMLESDWGPTGPLRVRMALHTGEADADAHDYYGQPLNRCARVLATGHGGQILLSQATAELVREELPEGVAIQDLGEHRLRDLTRPERIGTLVVPGLPGDFPPLRGLESFPHNLPQHATTFIGRLRELAEASELLATSRLTSLVGPGGTGKTRLAVQIAADTIDAYPGGAWFVDLAGATSPEMVPQAAASVLGLREEAGRSLVDTLQAHLSRSRALLLLDNCEHLIAACAELAVRLIQSCSDLKVLATTREELRVRGEQVYRVPPLPAPETDAGASPQELAQYESVQLFMERASAVRPGFDLTESNGPSVALICRRLDGLPLAIELAAARMKAMNPEQIVERLDKRFRLLKGGDRTARERQQTLQALVDWSYDLLTGREQCLFRRLSVFVGGFSLEAAEAVGTCDEIEGWEVMDLVVALVEKSLVAVDERGGEAVARYRMLDTLRAYGLERAEDLGELAELRGAHLAHFREMVGGGDGTHTGLDATDWVHRLDADRYNMVAAVSWAVESDPEVALDLCYRLHPYWHRLGRWTEARTLLGAALDRTDCATSPARGRVLWAAGFFASQQADGESAVRLLREGLECARQAGDQEAVAMCLGTFGVVARHRGDAEGARHWLEDALSAARASGDKVMVARLLADLAAASLGQGDHAAVRRLTDEGLRISRELGARAVTAHHLMITGHLALAEGRHAEAVTLLRESLEINRALDFRNHVAATLSSLGMAACLMGDTAQALAAHEEALVVQREIGDRWGVAATLHGMGEASLASGDPGAALDLFRQSLSQARGVGSRLGMASCIEGVAKALARQGSCRAAAVLLGASERMRASLDSPTSDTEAAALAHTADLVRRELGEPAFVEAHGQGMSMSESAAVAAALGPEH